MTGSERCKSKLKGFSLVEVMLAISLLGLIVISLSGTLSFGQESSISGGNTTRATFIADEGLEAVENITDESFANLADGTYGLAVSGGTWIFSGSSDTTDIFTRQITISSIDAYTKQISSEVTWQEGPGANNRTITLESYITDWSRIVLTSNDVFRVTEYYISLGSFTGTNYDLTLKQDLGNNYFVIVQGSDGNGTNWGTRGPDENYISLTGDPNGTGDLSTSGAANRLSFTRQNAVDSWVGTVTVAECLEDCSNGGFTLLDVQRVAHSGSSTSGSDSSGTAWGDIGQVMLLGGFNGAGCDTTRTASSASKVCHTRIYPSGGNQINWTRSSGSVSLTTATSTVMVLEWGGDWSVQRVNVTGSAGGNGADQTGEYNTASISSVVRNNTWVWGTGYTSDQGIGDASEGTLITLGNGVSINASESTVAVGQEYSDSRSFEVYALTHNDLSVDYDFKTDGDSGSLIYDSTTDAAANATARMSLVYNGTNGTGNAYPRPHFSSRYISDTTIRLERRRSGQAFPAWVQGIDFSGIQTLTGGSTGNWSSPQQESQINLAGNNNAEWIDVQGNYTYLTRNGGSSDFAVIDISTLASPTVVGSLSLPGTLGGVIASGNYAYVSSSDNSSELQIIDISTPSTPSVVGNFNSSGNGNGLSVDVVGSTAYLCTANQGGNELFIVDVSTPSSPSLLGGISLGDSCRDVVVQGNYAYIASNSNSQELQVVDISTPSSPSLTGSLNLSGNSNSERLDISGSTVILARSSSVYVVDVTTPSTPSVLGSYGAGGDVNGVAYFPSQNYVFAVTVVNSQEFIVLDVSTPSSISVVGTYNASGDIEDVTYEPGLDRAFAAGYSNSEEFIIFAPQ